MVMNGEAAVSLVNFNSSFYIFLFAVQLEQLYGWITCTIMYISAISLPELLSKPIARHRRES